MSSTAVEEPLESAARRALLEKWQALSARMGLTAIEAQALREEHESDWEDRAASVATAERLDRLIDNERLQLALVQAAIARLDNGTWGTCLVCGRAIDAKRLRLVPEAPHCSRCAPHD
jgi:RNA polymerase-binding transcription factor DksA